MSQERKPSSPEASDSRDDADHEVAGLVTVPETPPPIEEQDDRDDNQSLDLDYLKPESLRALRRLSRYKAPKDEWPLKRRCAVAIALFGGRKGDLFVLLSTRSRKLRSHPGEVALPGGHMEDTDLDLEYTARREAFEEVGLPMHVMRVRYITRLRPFLSRSNLLVTPYVFFILDPTIKPHLNPDEVDSIFAHPLQSFLFDKAKEPVLHSLPDPSKTYHTSYDIRWWDSRPYRMHRFEGKRRPITGFTSDILIEAASLAYGPPEFERKARGQLSRRKLIQTAITSNPDIWGDNEDTDEVNNKRNRPPRVSSSSHSLDRKTGEIKSKL